MLRSGYHFWGENTLGTVECWKGFAELAKERVVRVGIGAEYPDEAQAWIKGSWKLGIPNKVHLFNQAGDLHPCLALCEAIERLTAVEEV